MKGAHGGHFIGYNVQVAVDARHDLIVSEDVVQAANDLGQLGALAIAAKQELGVEKLQAIADKGLSPERPTRGVRGRRLGALRARARQQERPGAARARDFPQGAFSPRRADGHLPLPGAAVLPRVSLHTKGGKASHLYWNRAMCRGCALRSACTNGPWCALSRRVNKAAAERAGARVAANPGFVARRKSIVEHVFGTLRVWGHDHFLMRGLGIMRAELSLSAVAYNLRRVLNLCGVAKLLVALRQPAAA